MLGFAPDEELTINYGSGTKVYRFVGAERLPQLGIVDDPVKVRLTFRPKSYRGPERCLTVQIPRQMLDRTDKLEDDVLEKTLEFLNSDRREGAVDLGISMAN